MLLQAGFMSGPNNSRIGTINDLSSTEDDITHRCAKELELKEETVQTTVSGIGATKYLLETKIYTLPLMVNGQLHKIPCYGLEDICSFINVPEQYSLA